MKKGLLIVFSGPSGVGKGTVIKELMKRDELNLVYSISMTTRKAREGEVDGVNYFFVSEEEFKEAIANQDLLEYANFVGNYYGTPKKYVEQQRALGKNVLLEIETVGAKKVLDICKDDPGCLSIFILPPSIEELERRIRGRQTENEETILKRVAKARLELQETKHYKHHVTNVAVEDAVNEVAEIILKASEEL